MSILDQSVPPPIEPSVLSQQLDMPQVDLPPEDSANLSRIVPELDLLGEKSKDKEDSEEEEVSAAFLVLTLGFGYKIMALFSRIDDLEMATRWSTCFT